MSAAAPALVRRWELRLMLASAAALCLSTAWVLSALTNASLGRCLQLSEWTALHCPLCYLAALLFAAAITPWPPRLAAHRA